MELLTDDVRIKLPAEAHVTNITYTVDDPTVFLELRDRHAPDASLEASRYTDKPMLSIFRWGIQFNVWGPPSAAIAPAPAEDAPAPLAEVA